MATLTVQAAGRPGAILTFDAAGAGGDDFANTGAEVLIFRNDSGGPKDVTIITPQKIDNDLLDVQDLAITQIPAGGAYVLVGPFPETTYGSTTNITYPGGESGIFIAVVNSSPT